MTDKWAAASLCWRGRPFEWDQEKHLQLITQYWISQIFATLFKFHEFVLKLCLRNLSVLLETVDVNLPFYSQEFWMFVYRENPSGTFQKQKMHFRNIFHRKKLGMFLVPAFVGVLYPKHRIGRAKQCTPCLIKMHRHPILSQYPLHTNSELKCPCHWYQNEPIFSLAATNLGNDSTKQNTAFNMFLKVWKDIA